MYTKYNRKTFILFCSVTECIFSASPQLPTLWFWKFVGDPLFLCPILLTTTVLYIALNWRKRRTLGNRQSETFFFFWTKTWKKLLLLLRINYRLTKEQCCFCSESWWEKKKEKSLLNSCWILVKAQNGHLLAFSWAKKRFL